VELKVSSRSQDGHVIVTVAGEIDLYTAPKLQASLSTIIDAAALNAHVVIDMAGVDFCDSTGMNVLLSALRQAQERGGKLELAAPRPAMLKILQVTGLDSVFTVTALPPVPSAQPFLPGLFAWPPAGSR
jgi:anti-sigma B factor antagonist